MMRAAAFAVFVAAMIWLYKAFAALGPAFCAGVIAGSLIVHIGYRAAYGRWIEF